jgi:anti-sigma regulatory factor (Ser/Thr protein kinase)
MDLRLRARADAPRLAREAIEPLRAGLPERAFEDVRLVVTELVTNAVIHAGLGADDTISLRVRRARGVTRIEVEDRGDGFGWSDDGSFTSPGGRGLMLVSRMSLRWGLESNGGALVWCELSNAERPRAGAAAPAIALR